MFDDLDDLLNDEPTQTKPKVERAKSAMPISAVNKKQDEDFDWDPPSQQQYTFGGNGKPQSAADASNPTSGAAYRQMDTHQSFGLGYNQKKNNDDWEGLEETDKSFIGGGGKSSAFFGGGGSSTMKNQPYGEQRGSVSSQYAGFGVLGRSKSLAPSFQDSPDKNDADDILDTILTDFEAKKGMENEKPKDHDKRPQTTDVFRNTQAPPSRTVKSTADPWGRDNFDELDDLEDDKSKTSAKNSNIDSLQQKKRALFGIGGGNLTNPLQNNNANHERTRSHYSKSLGKLNDDDVQSRDGGMQGLGLAMNASVSQGSEIEVIETAFSRQKSTKKIQDSTSNRQGQSFDKSRPPTGATLAGGQQYNNQFSTIDRAVTSSMNANTPLNYAQSNFGLPPQRPFTGKPPKYTGIGQNEDADDNVLDLLGDSKDKSNKGSVPSGGGNMNYALGSIEHFDDNQHSYDEEDGEEGENGILDQDDSDEEDTGFYVPTALSRVGGSGSKPKPTKKSKRSKNQGNTIKQSQPISAVSQGLQSIGGSNFGDKNLELNNSERRAQTLDSEGENPIARLGPKTNVKGSNQPTSYSQVQAVGSNVSNQGLPPSQSRDHPILPLDEKSLLQRQIEDERQRIKLAQDRNRKQIDDIREEHKRDIKSYEEKQQLKMQLYNEEKRKLIDEMNKTIELEKERLSNIQKIDAENRELQYKRNLENQRNLYEEQHDSLKNQLQQKVQLNIFAEEIQSSSGNINTLVTKLSSAQEGELRRREEELKRRDQELQSRKKNLAERKAITLQRKRKMQNETEDLYLRQNETDLDYERQKSEIISDVDQAEEEHQQAIREIRNRTIDMEVETRKTRSEIDQVIEAVLNNQKQGEDRIDELIREKRQYVQAREDLRADIKSSERELKSKLIEIQEKEQEVQEEEKDFTKREYGFELQSRAVVEEHEKLQEQLDKYCIEREQFDREAMKVKEQGERDQLDSEKIGYFKANKERLREELQQLRVDLEAEKESIRQDKIKLSMFKNELKTRQKTIETMRYEYIKNSDNSQNQYLDDARDIGFYKLSKTAGGPSFYPINPPSFDQKKENIEPNIISQESRSFYQRQSATVTQTYVPRFNYDEYMRNLREKLSSQAPTVGNIAGSDFQYYIMKERENYMRGLHEFDVEQPLIQSISQFKNSHRQHDVADIQDATFNLGSLQNSQNDKGANKMGLMSSQMGKSSGNSLHFISKNFSNSPVEEVDKDKEESRLYL